MVLNIDENYNPKKNDFTRGREISCNIYCSKYLITMIVVHFSVLIDECLLLFHKKFETKIDA